MHGPSAREADSVLKLARRKYASVREITIGSGSWTIRDTGQGDATLVLLPGSLGTAEIFSHQIVGLSDRFRCIAVDYPDQPAAELARNFTRLLDQLRVRHATVLGASLAGYWIQYISEWGRIERIILASTFCDSSELGTHPLFDVQALRNQTGAEVKSAWMERLSAQPSSRLRDIQLVLLRDGQDGELLRKRLLAAATAAPAPLMPIEQTRIGIISCDDDPLLFEQTRRALLARYPAAHQLCLPSGGHYPHVTQFEFYNDFLDRVIYPAKAD